MALPTFHPGEKYLRADDLNRMVAEIERQSVAKVDGPAILDTTGSGVALTILPPPPGFWALLTGEGGGSGSGLGATSGSGSGELGRYSWVEVTRVGPGMFSALEGGRSGSTTRDAARDANGTTAIPVGTCVWMRLGHGQATEGGSGSGSGGSPGTDQEWVFDVQPVVQIVRQTSPTPNANGWFPGYVDRYDPATGLFASYESIWIFDVNSVP